MSASVPISRLEATRAALADLRQRRRQELLLLAVAGSALPVLVILLLATLSDLAWHLSPGWRWAAAATTAATTLGAAAWLCVLACRRLNDQVMALLVEKARPAADNRLINAIQFAESGEQPEEFINDLLAESPVKLELVLPRELYSPRPRRWLQRLYPLVALAWLAPLLIAPGATIVACLRIVFPFAALQPHADTVIVDLSPGDVSLKRGQELAIAVTLTGAIPKQAWVVWDKDSGQAEKLPLEPDAQGVFMGRTQPLFETGRYRIIAGDARSAWFTASVANPPGLVHWEAAVAPPSHTGLATYRLRPDTENPEVLSGAAIVLAGLATSPLAAVEIYQGDKAIATAAINGQRQFTVKGDVVSTGPLRLRLQAPDGMAADHPLPFILVPDKSPTIALVDTPTTLTVATGQAFPLAFRAEDDFGVAKVGLERLVDSGPHESVTEASPESSPARVFPGRFLVDSSTFKTRGGTVLRFRLWAEDHGANASRRRGYSPIIQVTFPEQDTLQKDKDNAARQAEENIATLIKKQREALRDTRQIADLVTMGKPTDGSRLAAADATQKEIRTLAAALLQNRDVLGGLGDILAGLVNQEMKTAIELLAEVYRTPEASRGKPLGACITVQNTILAALTGMHENLQHEHTHQDKSDIFATLQKVIKLQRDNLKDTKAASQGQDIAIPALVHNQDRIAEAILAFTDLCLSQAELRAKDDFATQLRAAHDIIAKDSTYETALAAAEELDDKELDNAAAKQQTVLKTLMKALNILNQWRVNNAKKIVEDATEVLNNVAKHLDEMEKKQARIAEVTRDLKARGPMDDEAREKLAEMDKEQEEMADLVEQLANDLYQFPELPVCNELNAKMREVYEDVLQALDSENLPSIEIAVQKEDSLLDAIRSTKERIEDVEMWLPDVPDHFVWNMESFDTDEFPDIPLVPLPDELEDLVGELLDQAESIDAQSQDTTGNNIVADMEMGWAVMDGPMPCFSAKGKSGNTRPNDNEMTGRSGAGREGQSTGELVENHVKGYEGRETHARRTGDQFQKGMVTEDENSTLDARATGGGKLGGESETIGMFGAAPRRDLHTKAHGMTPQKLRQEAEVLYATARLLYIGSGGLGEAARDLRGLEQAPPELRELGNLRKRVLRRLQDSQIELKGGAVLPMPVTAVSQTGGNAVDDSDLEKLSREYLPLLNDYYRSLGNDKIQ
ncbi:MAG: hypothetical protein GX574_09735 [Lentisphaerae bacterium]|nr:hypothetical protein [Lentisphaerota bacterium]